VGRNIGLATLIKNGEGEPAGLPYRCSGGKSPVAREGQVGLLAGRWSLFASEMAGDISGCKIYCF
jgi:hypothetical protein